MAKVLINGVETETDLTGLTDEQWKTFKKSVTEEYNRRLKVKLVAWFEKSKIGGARVKDIIIAFAGIAVFFLAVKEILK